MSEAARSLPAVLLLVLLSQCLQQAAAGPRLRVSWAEQSGGPPIRATRAGPEVNLDPEDGQARAAADYPIPSPCLPDDSGALDQKVCRDEEKGKCVLCKKPAWLLFPGQDTQAFGGPEGWQAAARGHVNYRFNNGPAFENYALDNNCNYGQGDGIWYSSPNANRRVCEFDKPYRYAYFNIMNALTHADPGLPADHQAAMQQCTAALFRRPRPGSYISITDLDNGKNFYSGPLDPLFFSTPSWEQEFRQAYDGSCGQGTYRLGASRFPYSQGRPDIFSARGSSVPASPTGFKDACAVIGSTPEETKYTATSPPGAFSVDATGRATVLSANLAKANMLDTPGKVLPLHAPYKLSVAESGLAFAVDLEVLRTKPNYKGTFNLEYKIVTDGRRPTPGSVVPEDPVDTSLFCMHCLEQCANYCRVNPDTGTWSDPCFFKPGVTQVTPLGLPQLWVFSFRITLEGRGSSGTNSSATNSTGRH